MCIRYSIGCTPLHDTVLHCSRSSPNMMVGRQGNLQESSGVVTPGAISDSMSAVPEGFSRYWLAREAPCTEDQPRMESMLLPL